nr:MAG: ORF1 [TTV-like mini virus]
MPPFQRRRYNYRRWWNTYRPRHYYRRRRPRNTFFRRKRRHRRVRRKKFYKRFKKLKSIKIRQWQPTSIKKCKIEGYLCLFQAGPGRYGNNYALWKESFFPQLYPGGGGWSIQQISLGILYKEHKDYMNYWTRSNTNMNLCRYLGCRIELFREPYTDYVFTYFQNVPKTVNNLFYSSHHPIRLLTHKRKKTIPSFNTQPHKRKPYKTMWIPPPKLMKNQWFFQQHLSDYPLLTFATSACSLTGMFGSCNSISNNVTLYCLDTTVLPTPAFQYRNSMPNWGYHLGTNYLYGILKPAQTFTNNYIHDMIYLGNTMHQYAGEEIGIKKDNFEQTYTKEKWGNMFYWEYMSGDAEILLVNKNPKEINQMATTATTKVDSTWKKQAHYIFKARYNPFHDKGTGNMVYMLPTYDFSVTNWNPPKDPDLIWSNKPLWLVLWGIEDIIKRMGKCTNIDMDWILVIKSSYLLPPQPHYVILSYDFIHGRGPYDTEREYMTNDDLTNWYPRFKYQRQAIDNLIRSGPAVATGDNCKNIQAKIKYHFFFKWGGLSEPQETIFDPNSQPITPYPNNLYFSNEINDPQSSITTEIYPWDFRRDFLTKTATDRIKESSIYDPIVFTDGKQSATDLPIQQKETQEKETQKTQEQTLLQHLQQLQQYNQQLQQRLRSIKEYTLE